MEYAVNQISPGVCPCEGCPPPTRIECIVVDKVYDSCFQLHEITREVTADFEGSFAVGDIISCQLNGDISCIELSRVSVGDGFFTITLLVTVPILLTNPENPEETVSTTFTFIKTVTLCCPEGVNPDCSESTINFCSCVVTGTNGVLIISCTVQICLVIKCILTVQLLVPSYGFCVPAPCITLPGVCPPTPPAQCF